MVLLGERGAEVSAEGQAATRRTLGFIRVGYAAVICPPLTQRGGGLASEPGRLLATSLPQQRLVAGWESLEDF